MIQRSFFRDLLSEEFVNRNPPKSHVDKNLESGNSVAVLEIILSMDQETGLQSLNFPVSDFTAKTIKSSALKIRLFFQSFSGQSTSQSFLHDFPTLPQ
jgi:hypothetical protein